MILKFTNNNIHDKIKHEAYENFKKYIYLKGWLQC